MIALLAFAALLSASVSKAADLPPPKKEICDVGISVTQLPIVNMSITAYADDLLTLSIETNSDFTCFIPGPVASEEFPTTALHGREVDSCFSADILKTSDKKGAKIGVPTIRKL